jgi:hypothetical protein
MSIRVIRAKIGTNVLAGMEKEGILKAYHQSLDKARTASIPEKWDGKATERIWSVLASAKQTQTDQIHQIDQTTKQTKQTRIKPCPSA